MADTVQTTSTAVEVSACEAKVSSFATLIHNLFEKLTPTVSLIRKDAEKDQAHQKEFKEIDDMKERISEQNKKTLEQSKILEVYQLYGKYEENIKSQYKAYQTMVKEDSASKVPQVEEFKKKYKMLEEALGLKVLYKGVTNKPMLFGGPLLEVYLMDCKYDWKLMERRCSKLIDLFSMGLQSLMAYTYFTGGDMDEISEKWASKVEEIRAAMEEALSQCKKN